VVPWGPAGGGARKIGAGRQAERLNLVNSTGRRPVGTAKRAPCAWHLPCSTGGYVGCIPSHTRSAAVTDCVAATTRDCAKLARSQRAELDALATALLRNEWSGWASWRWGYSTCWPMLQQQARACSRVNNKTGYRFVLPVLSGV
jgi:hypothetical protein